MSQPHQRYLPTLEFESSVHTGAIYDDGISRLSMSSRYRRKAVFCVICDRQKEVVHVLEALPRERGQKQLWACEMDQEIEELTYLSVLQDYLPCLTILCSP